MDADWQNAWACGDEAVGGSTATPDQDVVDELGEALGVAQAPDAEFRTTGEILAERDRHRWRLEREASAEDTKRPGRQRLQPASAARLSRPPKGASRSSAST